ncbi:MAG: ABC transporter permease, partial [Bacteroidota bacterium]
IILNQAAAKLSGIKNPINTMVWAPDSTEYKVIGIVKDFHFQSLRQSIEPVAILPKQNNFNYLSIKITDGDIPKTIQKLKEKWIEIDNSRPFNYFFLDGTISEYYDQETRLGQMYLYFSILAVFIGLLGLLGLSSYITEQKYKEIGIRKVFGASIKSIVFRLSTKFLSLVLISNIIAWPVAYFLMKSWLENFAYKEGLTLWVFIIATILSIGIAFITVSTQSYRAAIVNPAESLQNE